jgi:hypothetical protein
MPETSRRCHRRATEGSLPVRASMTSLLVKEVDMSNLFAALLLSIWGLMVLSAPRRKRYCRFSAKPDRDRSGS